MLSLILQHFTRGGSFNVYPIRIRPLTFMLHTLCIILYIKYSILSTIYKPHLILPGAFSARTYFSNSLSLSLSLSLTRCGPGTATVGSAPLEEEYGDHLFSSPATASTAELCSSVWGGPHCCHGNQEAGDRGLHPLSQLTSSTLTPPPSTPPPLHPSSQALKGLRKCNQIMLPLWVWLDDKVGGATAHLSHRSLVEAAYRLACQEMKGQRSVNCWLW